MLTPLQVILDAYRQNDSDLGPAASHHDKLQLLQFSANTAASLKLQVEAFQGLIKAQPGIDIASLAYTLAHHREKLPHRAFAIVQQGELVDVSTPGKAPAKTPNIHMIFSGQGAQWPQMGRELIVSDPMFRIDLENMDRALQHISHPPSWSIISTCSRAI